MFLEWLHLCEKNLFRFLIKDYSIEGEFNINFINCDGVTTRSLVGSTYPCPSVIVSLFGTFQVEKYKIGCPHETLVYAFSILSFDVKK